MIDLHQLLHVLLEIESFSNHLVAAKPQGSPKLWVPEDLEDTFCQLIYVPGGSQVAVLAFANQFWYSPYSGGYDRQCAGHCFQNGHGHTFVIRRVDKNISIPEEKDFLRTEYRRNQLHEIG